MNQHLENYVIGFDAEKSLGDNQMSRRGDRQKLGQSLDQPQNQALKQTQILETETHAHVKGCLFIELQFH